MSKPRPASTTGMPTRTQVAGPADLRLAVGVGLFRVGLLICVVAGFWALTHVRDLAGQIALGFSGGGLTASVVGVIIMLAARRQGGRIRKRA